MVLSSSRRFERLALLPTCHHCYHEIRVVKPDEKQRFYEDEWATTSEKGAYLLSQSKECHINISMALIPQKTAHFFC